MPPMKPAFQAVLFDLDGTLLDNNMDVFLPHYFERLAARVAHILPPREFVAHLMKATQQMLVNAGSATNEEVFAAAFYPLIGRSREELEPIFLDFYHHDFPALRQYTRPVPQARQVVQTAFDLGCDVVVSTNPLFPAVAMHQRLEWAGVAGFPYRLVTAYENSRACKPNPVYFQQILDTINCPAESCLVVGDDLVDMAASQLGCSTFLITQPATTLDPGWPMPTYRGTLAGVEAVLRGAS